MRRPIVIVLFLSLLVPACGMEKSVDHLHFDLKPADHNVLWIDRSVEASPLFFHIRPEGNATGPRKALFVPFRLDQMNDDSRWVGKGLTRVFWQNWTGQEVFSGQAYDEELFFASPAGALAAGRARGADLVVTGVVTRFLPGGTQADNELSLNVQIWDTASGKLMWSMEQAASMSYELVDDYILFTRKYRMPPDPVFALANRIANDMGAPVKAWSGGAGAVRFQPAASGAPGAEREVADAGPGPDAAARARMAEDLARPDVGVDLKIEFDVDQAVIRPEFHPLLNPLGQVMAEERFRGRSFSIAGHTDSDASEAYNQELSLRRAQAVKDYLSAGFGIPASLLEARGYGESRPLAPNTSAENKQRNRRVEVRLAG